MSTAEVEEAVRSGSVPNIGGEKEAINIARKGMKPHNVTVDMQRRRGLLSCRWLGSRCSHSANGERKARFRQKEEHVRPRVQEPKTLHVVACDVRFHGWFALWS